MPGKRTAFLNAHSGSELAAGETLTLTAITMDSQFSQQSPATAEALRTVHSQILDHIGQAVIVTDLEGRIIYLNPAASALYDWPIQEALGRTASEVTVPQATRQEADAIMERLRQGESWKGEFSVCRRDGSTFPALVTDSPIRDKSGNIIGVVGISTDLTERTQAEERLNHTIKEVGNLKTALDEHAIVSITDPRGTITYVNDKFCSISKYSRDELVGHDHRIINSDYHPKEYIANLWETIGNGQIWKGEFRNRAKDGSHYWVDATIVPFLNAAGIPYQHVAIRTDITRQVEAREALRKSEERYQLAFRGSQAGLWDWRVDTDRIIYSDRLLEILGYSSRKTSSPLSSFLEVIHPDDRDRTWNAVEQHLKERTPYHAEFRLKTESGEYRWFEASGQAAWDTEGTPYRMTGLAIDITGRKRAEQELLRSQRMESIGTLAGGMAHDLNNILAPLMIGVGLLMLDEKDEGRLKILSTMEANVKRGADMVRQVLSFARGVEGQRIPLHIPEILRDVEKIANDTFLKNIQIQTIVTDEVWTVRGDPTQLHQVLLNLAVNARDAMPDGGDLTFSVANLTLDPNDTRVNDCCKPGAYVLIQVEDTGMGVAPELIERIFEPFFTTKDVGKGTGLGLSTTLGIIKSHGGCIRVFSTPGKGTRFDVYLPADPTCVHRPPANSETPLPHGNGELILVVDDEPMVRKFVRQTLETFGYRTVLAASGQEAIDLYQRSHDDIQVVLTDIMMPGMNGATLIQHLREINREVRIIASSGSHANGGVSTDSNIRCLLPKPYSTEEMLAALRTVLSTTTNHGERETT